MKNPKNLTVRIDMLDAEVKECFVNAGRSYSNFAISSTLYYKSYLKNILGSEYETADIDAIFQQLESIKELVNFRMYSLNNEDVHAVRNVLRRNNYFAKNTNRREVSVKLFSTFYKGKQCVIKTYMFDHNCASLKWSLEQKVKNEILFQTYAKTLNHSLDFISPKLYTWGTIYKYKPCDISAYSTIDAEYKVIYLIMEYIPYMTLKESAQNTHDIYEKIENLDVALQGHLLCHNDLHAANILVSPLPQICIIDFGEASYGPRRTIQ